MSEQKLQKHTLNLRAGDYDMLAENFVSQGIPAAGVIRMIVSNFVDKLRAQHAEIPTPKTDLENE